MTSYGILLLRNHSEHIAVGVISSTSLGKIGSNRLHKEQHLLNYTRRDTIYVEDLEERLTEVGAQASRSEVSQLVSAMDVEGDGRINREEFNLIMETLALIASEKGKTGLPAGHWAFGQTGSSLSLREVAWFTLEDPQFSSLAYVMSLVIITIIMISSLVIVLEAEPGLDGSPALYGIEVASVCVFSAEFLLRLATTPDYRKFALGFLNYIDLLAILPFYIELGVVSSGGTVNQALFGPIRLVRVVRVLKTTKYISWMRMLVDALADSAAPLGMAGFLSVIGFLLCASAVYFAERGTPDPDTKTYIGKDGGVTDFQSIIDGVYFSIIAATAVGYGDIVPKTPAGQVIGSFVLLAGIILTAFPISIFSASFSSRFEVEKRRRSIAKEHADTVLLKLLQLDETEHSSVQLPRYPSRFAADFDGTDIIATPTDELVGLSMEHSKGLGGSSRAHPHKAARSLPLGSSSSPLSYTKSFGGYAKGKGSRSQSYMGVEGTIDSNRNVPSDLVLPKSRNSPEAPAQRRSLRPSVSFVDFSRQSSSGSHSDFPAKRVVYESSRCIQDNAEAMQARRRDATFRPGAEDLQALRSCSFESWDLTDPQLLSSAMQLIARDSRRRIMLKVRRAQRQSRDRILYQLASRWEVWFGSGKGPDTPLSTPATTPMPSPSQQGAKFFLDEGSVSLGASYRTNKSDGGTYPADLASGDSDDETAAVIRSMVSEIHRKASVASRREVQQMLSPARSAIAARTPSGKSGTPGAQSTGSPGSSRQVGLPAHRNLREVGHCQADKKQKNTGHTVFDAAQSMDDGVAGQGVRRRLAGRGPSSLGTGEDGAIGSMPSPLLTPATFSKTPTAVRTSAEEPLFSGIRRASSGSAFEQVPGPAGEHGESEAGLEDISAAIYRPIDGPQIGPTDGPHIGDPDGVLSPGSSIASHAGSGIGKARLGSEGGTSPAPPSPKPQEDSRQDQDHDMKEMPALSLSESAPFAAVRPGTSDKAGSRSFHPSRDTKASGPQKCTGSQNTDGDDGDPCQPAASGDRSPVAMHQDARTSAGGRDGGPGKPARVEKQTGPHGEPPLGLQGPISRQTELRTNREASAHSDASTEPAEGRVVRRTRRVRRVVRNGVTEVEEEETTEYYHDGQSQAGTIGSPIGQAAKSGNAAQSQAGVRPLGATESEAACPTPGLDGVAH